MRRLFLFLAIAVAAAAQAIPGRYIVEFTTEPAAELMTAGGRVAPGNEPLAIALRRLQIATEHFSMEARVNELGGRVTHHYDTLINGMAVTIPDAAVAELRQMANVRSVTPVVRHRKLLDHAVKVHRIDVAQQALPNGKADAREGILIGMFDTGIDATHPAFQGFSTPIPTGYPKLSAPTESVNTNNKIIVARSYLSTTGSADQDGHGTGTSMAAAGLTNDLTLVGIQGIPPITGAAPAAWLGNYNVFDDNGGTDSATFLLALQDAFNDGVNVVNYSVGGPVLDANVNSGPEGRALTAALAAGMIVVAAAGNSASFINLDSGFEERYAGGGTINDPAIVTGVIAAGSNLNDRYLGYAVAVGGVPPYPALVAPAEQGVVSGVVTGVLVDVTSVGGDSLGCSAYPANSLQGMVAVIKRGTCFFDDNSNNAQNAGAVAAVIYDNTAEALLGMQITATLPATSISQANGQDLVARIKANSNLKVLVDFTGNYALPQASDNMSVFSSSGPTAGGGIKPDLVATGHPVVTATAGGW